MRYLYLPKKDLDKFIEYLMKKHKVVAPVKKENQFVFAEISGSKEIALDYIPTVLPIKKYLIPQHEKLGTFKMGQVAMTDASITAQPTVIFAAHTCDIDGMECLDAVFHNSPADPYYKKRKKYLTIIGYECMEPCDEYANCRTMDTHLPKAGYDIMITPSGSNYIFHINSTAGDELIGNNPIFKSGIDDKAKAELRKLRSDKLKKFGTKMKASFKELPKIFDYSYKSKVWEDVGKRCVSCGNCTIVCPTCYCFDINDDVKLDMTGGSRDRVWDSCQYDEFATVAGGENFRKERLSRQRHRYYRKFSYSVKKYNKFFCTGCGRCTRACVADISLIETVNDLTKEYKNV